jgi:hypothetical protein
LHAYHGHKAIEPQSVTPNLSERQSDELTVDVPSSVSDLQMSLNRLKHQLEAFDSHEPITNMYRLANAEDTG